ncbi:glycosyltransferase [Lactobacillus sp. AN1001]
MKIAFVMDGLQIGGIEKVGASYVKMFNKLGHKVTLINLDPTKKEMLNLYSGKVYRKINYKFSRKASPEQYAQLIKRFWWGRYVYPIVYTLLSAINILRKKIYRIFVDHEEYDVVIAFSGHFNDLTFVSSNFVRGKKKLCWLHGALYGYLLISDGYLNLYRKIQNLVVLVDDAQIEALVYNHENNLNITKIYNPIQRMDNGLVTYNNVEKIKKLYGNFILMVARLDYPHKDHYTVIKAFEILCRKGIEDYNLVFLGEGPEKENIEKFISELNSNISSKIYLLGSVENVDDYYKSASMLVHASVAGEGLPTVILEALSEGCPVISTDSKVGPREIIGDNKYGLLIPIQDAETMADNFYLMIMDEELRNKYSVLGKERAKDFAFEKIEKEVDRLIRDL